MNILSLKESVIVEFFRWMNLQRQKICKLIKIKNKAE